MVDDGARSPAGGVPATAIAVGHLSWCSGLLATATGRWAAEAPIPAVRVHLALRSAHHAWHAAVLRERLPVRAGVDPDELVVAPDPSLGSAVEAVTGLAADDGARAAVARLAALERVLAPTLLARLDGLLVGAGPVADAPLLRWGGIVATDLVADGRSGAALLACLLTGGNGITAGAGRAGAPPATECVAAAADGVAAADAALVPTSPA